jgi:hypothetical protein
MTRYIVPTVSLPLHAPRHLTLKQFVGKIVFDCRFVFNAFLVKTTEKLEPNNAESANCLRLPRSEASTGETIGNRFEIRQFASQQANKNSIMSRMKCEATARGESREAL